MNQKTVETSRCSVSIAESPGEGPAVLLVHGNSSCKEVFRNQLQGPVGARDKEIDAYVRSTCGINAPFEDFLHDAVARTDGRARELMLSSFMAGSGHDQQAAATTICGKTGCT